MGGSNTLLHGIEDSLCYSPGIRQDAVLPVIFLRNSLALLVFIPHPGLPPQGGKEQAYNKICAANQARSAAIARKANRHKPLRVALASSYP